MWEERCEMVRDAMAQHVQHFVTPISTSKISGRGAAAGTGAYIRLRQSVYLLTCAHVIEGYGDILFGHLPGPTDDYVQLTGGFKGAGWPIDMVVTNLGNAWATPVIPASLLNESYAPVDNELLFFMGFPGSTALHREDPTLSMRYSWFGGPLVTPGTPMLTQAFRTTPANLLGYDYELHTAIHYPALAQRHAGELPVDTFNAKGLSGGLVWDTKYVATTRTGGEWAPEHAMVCGLVIGWSSRDEAIYVSKIENWKPLLLQCLREEAAYQHWVSRGCPLWDEMVDWLWCEQQISEL